MKLLDEDQAKEAIQKGIAGPGSSTFAVAFWGEGAIEALGPRHQ